MNPLLQSARTELVPPPERAPAAVFIMAGLLLALPFLLFGAALSDVGASTIAAAFLYRSHANADWAWTRRPWLLIGAALWAFLTVRGFLSIDPQRSGLGALVWGRFLVFAAAVEFLLVRSPTLRRGVLYALSAMCLFVVVDALIQLAFGYDLLGKPLVRYQTPDGTGGTLSYHRLTGPLDIQAVGRLLFFVGLPAIVWFTLIASDRQLTWPLRLFGAVAVLAIYGTIILSGERMTTLLAFAAFGVIVLIVLRPRLRNILAICAAGLIAVSIFLAASPHLLARHLSTITEFGRASETLYVRGMMSGLTVFRDNPAVGVGMKNFRKACPRSFPDMEPKDACPLLYPHNLWLQWLAETGVIGTLMFAAMLVAALQPALRQWRSWAVDALLAGATISVLAKVWPIATSGNIFSNWREVMFWFTLAIASSAAASFSIR